MLGDLCCFDVVVQEPAPQLPRRCPAGSWSRADREPVVSSPPGRRCNDNERTVLSCQRTFFQHPEDGFETACFDHVEPPADSRAWTAAAVRTCPTAQIAARTPPPWHVVPLIEHLTNFPIDESRRSVS
jgi:hypothetical protein